jgi:hypothetical protein
LRESNLVARPKAPDPSDAPIDSNAAMSSHMETPDHSLEWTINDNELLAWLNESMRLFEAIVYGACHMRR